MAAPLPPCSVLRGKLHASLVQSSAKRIERDNTIHMENGNTPSPNPASVTRTPFIPITVESRPPSPAAKWSKIRCAHCCSPRCVSLSISLHLAICSSQGQRKPQRQQPSYEHSSRGRTQMLKPLRVEMYAPKSRYRI